MDGKALVKLENEMAKGDLDATLVYADHLLQAGDPRGDLIQIQHQRTQRPKDAKLVRAEKALLTKHRGTLVPETPASDKKSVSHTWRLGFLDKITLKAATPAVIRAVVDHPSARFVRELEIDAGFRMTPGVILALAAHPRPALRSLTLRQGFEAFSDDIVPDPKDPSYKPGYGGGRRQDKGNVLWKALPNLTSLTMKAYQVIGELKHPKLEELTIEGCPICDDKWDAPKLEKLTWEVGDDETGTNTDAGSYMVAAIWEGKLPALRRVDLQGCSAIIDDEVLDEEEESDEEIEDTCAASLLLQKKFVKAAARFDELLLPEKDYKTNKAILKWLDDWKKKKKKTK